MAEKVAFDFSSAAPREQTNAEKYTLREKLFGTSDVEPLWVADMDINTPAFVIEAVQKRLMHPIVGYEDVPDSAYEAQIAWLKRRHNLDSKREEYLHSHSVVASMSVAIEAFTNKGDGVIVQTPVYPPFFHSVVAHERRVVKNSLKQDAHGVYRFDIDDLRSKITPDVKLLLLCSPHNPVGRVWTKEELTEIAEICYEHNIVLFSDEIHSDIVYAPSKHTPFASLSKEAASLCITAFGVGKTFNMAGFAMSTVLIQNEALRERYKKVYDKIHFAQNNALSHVAFEAAYIQGDAWLEALKLHLYKNYKILEDLAQEYSDLISITPLEGSYLAWIDCRAMGLKDKELRDFFVNDVKIGLNAGISFGREGSGFMRLNFAIASDKMSALIDKLRTALANQRIKVGKNRLG